MIIRVFSLAVSNQSMRRKKTNITSADALERLMDLCSRSEKSPYEITTKLKQWGLEAEADAILDKLKAENFISPERFAHAFARDKMNFNRWGRVKIRYYLKGHGIPEFLVESALDQLDQEGYRDMIFSELKKKLDGLKIKDPFQKKGRVYSFGMQRGYEPDLINEFLGQQEY